MSFTEIVCRCEDTVYSIQERSHENQRRKVISDGWDVYSCSGPESPRWRGHLATRDQAKTYALKLADHFCPADYGRNVMSCPIVSVPHFCPWN